MTNEFSDISECENNANSVLQRLCLEYKKFSLKTLTTHCDIPRVCLQRLPPMTPPWPPLVLEALPLLLHQDRWDLNTIFNPHHHSK